MEKLERLVDSSKLESTEEQLIIPKKISRLMIYTSLFIISLSSSSALIYEWSYQRAETRYLLEQGWTKTKIEQVISKDHSRISELIGRPARKFVYYKYGTNK